MAVWVDAVFLADPLAIWTFSDWKTSPLHRVLPFQMAALTLI